LIASKKSSEFSVRYLRELKRYLLAFAKGRKEMLMEDITDETVRSWFADRHETPVSEKADRGKLSSLFCMAVRRGWMKQNPVKRLEPIRIIRKPPKILTPAQAHILLRRTRDETPKMLAYLVLTLLCGLRPSEAQNMRWDRVRADHVVVDGATGKMRRRRVVHPLPMACQWLEDARALHGMLPLGQDTAHDYLVKARGWLVWESWHQDITRHTAASYWLAEVKDAGKVATEMGHSVVMLLTHYREHVTPEEAKEFWSGSLVVKFLPPE
jgi:integrase